jgi:hypothetical protein
VQSVKSLATDSTVPGSNPGRSRCPRGLRRGLVAARLLGLWVRIRDVHRTMKQQDSKQCIS